jgi:hypothetical protein
LHTKDALFSILAEGEGKTATQLQREIKKRYKKSVSFQAVLKAVRALIASHVLTKEKKLYTLNKDWIFEARKYLDSLYTEHFKVARPLKKVEMSKDITIYTVSNLFELDRLWNDLLTSWAKQSSSHKINVCRGKHAWWLLSRLEEEDILHNFMLAQGVKTYNIITSKTPLDKQAQKYYQDKGENTKILSTKQRSEVYLASFGPYILKFELPLLLEKRLEEIYTAKDIDLKRITDLFNHHESIEITLIKDELLASQTQKEMMDSF